jgi:hypothetical protein
MINQPPESRFAASLKPFFDSIDPHEKSAAFPARLEGGLGNRTLGMY